MSVVEHLSIFPDMMDFGHQKKKKKKRIRQYEKLPQLQERHDGKCNLIDTNYAWRVGESTPPIISLSEISYILSHISQCLFIPLSRSLAPNTGYYICFGVVWGLNSVTECVSACHCCNNTAVKACNDNTNPSSNSLITALLLMISTDRWQGQCVYYVEALCGRLDRFKSLMITLYM